MGYSRPEHILRGLKYFSLKFKGSEIFLEFFKGSQILTISFFNNFLFSSQNTSVGRFYKNDSYKKKRVRFRRPISSQSRGILVNMFMFRWWSVVKSCLWTRFYGDTCTYLVHFRVPDVFLLTFQPRVGVRYSRSRKCGGCGVTQQI